MDGFFETQDKIYFVIELIEDGDLFNNIVNRKTFDDFELKKLSKSIGFTDCKSISDIKDNCFDNNLSLEFFKSMLENHMNNFIPGWKFDPRFENTIKLIYYNLVYPFIGEDHCCMFTGFCMVK